MTSILIEKNIMVPMGDGAKLATDIYRLEDASPTPVLVVRTPYNKDHVVANRDIFDIIAGGASVTFEPGARTAWHSHPLGQTLIVTAGCGRVQRWDGPIEEIRPGDVIWIPPGEKHWHGASPTTAMTHIAIQEYLDGRAADWMEKVSDEQYQD